MKPQKRRIGEALFDFPCSQAFRGYEQQIEGNDPIIYSNIYKDDTLDLHNLKARVQELELQRQETFPSSILGQVRYLQNRLNQLEKAKKQSQDWTV